MRALITVALLAAACTAPAKHPPVPEAPDADVDAGAPVIDTPDASTADPDGGRRFLFGEVLPVRGPTGGGTRVEITGHGFMAGLERVSEAARLNAVKFGTNPAIDVEVIDDTLLSVKLPPGKAGPTDVRVTNPLGTGACHGCFTYFEQLHARSLTPAFGALRGGTTVVIKGEGLTLPLVVLFGGKVGLAAREVPGGLEVVTPAGVAAGEVDVTLFGPQGVEPLRRAFRYDAPLRASLSPSFGGAGTAVHFTGTGLERVTAVRFGAASVPYSETVAVPPGAPGAVDVTFEAPGESWVVRAGFSYVGATGPALYAVQPRLAAEGSTVSIIGDGLATATSVSFSGHAAPVLFATANEVHVRVPMGVPRVSDVTVDAQTLPAALTLPVALQALSPARGQSGTAVVLSSLNLPPDAEGALNAVPIAPVAAFMTPEGAGQSDLWVRSASDPENEAVLRNAFTYDEALWAGAVLPPRASIAGGARVTVFGTGFGPGVAVSFGALRAKDVKVLDSHVLTCRVPRSEVGAVDVTVDTIAAASAMPKAFAFFDPRSNAGGVSGAPLAGTLNVTVLQPNGKVIPLARVMLGTDHTSPLQGLTDARGQISFSADALVKAQLVSAWKDGFVATSVAAVGSENVTLLIDELPGGPPPPPPPLIPGIPITGHVTGFKAPRALVGAEQLQARVFVAQRSVYESVPFYPPVPRNWERWQVDLDNGEYKIVTQAGVHAVYAVLGIFNESLMTFEPVLMGIKRHVPVSAADPPVDVDIVLDMHLDRNVPITVDGPATLAGEPAANGLYAWIDLGGEGLIPHPYNWDTGLSSVTKLRTLAPTMTFPKFPQLDGESFLFMNYLTTAHDNPLSVAFARQPGDLTHGMGVGPMLDDPWMEWPWPMPGHFPDDMTWAKGTHPPPDMVEIRIYHLTAVGPILRWTVIMPGTEQHIPLIRPIAEWLENELPGQAFEPVAFAVRTPRFDVAQWTYEVFDYQSWLAFAQAVRSGWSL